MTRSYVHIYVNGTSEGKKMRRQKVTIATNHHRFLLLLLLLLCCWGKVSFGVPHYTKEVTVQHGTGEA